MHDLLYTRQLSTVLYIFYRDYSSPRFEFFILKPTFYLPSLEVRIYDLFYCILLGVLESWEYLCGTFERYHTNTACGPYDRIGCQFEELGVTFVLWVACPY